MRTRNVMLVLWIMLIGITYVNAISEALEEPTSVTLMANSHILHYDNEDVAVVQQNGQMLLINRKTSSGNTVEYADKTRRRIQILTNAGQSDAEINAIITFKQPETASDISDFEDLYNAQIVSVLFSSSEGGGIMPWPPDQSVIESINNDVSQFYSEEHDNNNFELITGFNTANTITTPSKLEDIIDNPDVLLVDIGPVDLLAQYPGAIVVPGTEFIFSSYEQYIEELPPVDNNTPTVDIFTPQSQNYSYSFEPLLVDYSVIDDRDLLTQNYVSLDNQTITINQINLSQLSLGQHNLRVEATDDAGNTGFDEVTFNVIDDIPPSSTDNADRNWHREDIVVTVTANDERAKVMKIHYKLNNGSEKVIATDADGIVGNPFVANITISTDGANNILEYWAEDEYGNLEEHKIISGIKVDKTPPTVKIISPTEGQVIDGKSFDIEYEAYDNLTGEGEQQLEWWNPDWKNKITVLFNSNLVKDRLATVKLDTSDSSVFDSENGLRVVYRNGTELARNLTGFGTPETEITFKVADNTSSPSDEYAIYFNTTNAMAAPTLSPGSANVGGVIDDFDDADYADKWQSYWESFDDLGCTSNSGSVTQSNGEIHLFADSVPPNSGGCRITNSNISLLPLEKLPDIPSLNVKLRYNCESPGYCDAVMALGKESAVDAIRREQAGEDSGWWTYQVYSSIKLWEDKLDIPAPTVIPGPSPDRANVTVIVKDEHGKGVKARVELAGHPPQRETDFYGIVDFHDVGWEYVQETDFGSGIYFSDATFPWFDLFDPVTGRWFNISDLSGSSLRILSPVTVGHVRMYRDRNTVLEVTVSNTVLQKSGEKDIQILFEEDKIKVVDGEKVREFNNEGFDDKYLYFQVTGHRGPGGTEPAKMNMWIDSITYGVDYDYSLSPVENYVAPDPLGIALLEIFLDDVKVEGLTHNVSELSSGEPTLTIKAYDHVGNVGTDSVSFIVDTLPPVTVNNYDGQWHNSDFAVTLSSTDERGEVKEVHYKLNNGPEQVISVDDDNASGDPFTTDVIISNENSNNAIEYWAVDNHGNVEEHNILAGIKLDKTMPVTTDNANNDWRGSDLTVTLTASDNLSGVARTVYCIDETNSCMPSTEGTSVAVSCAAGNVCRKYVRYNSVDVAGNAEAVKTSVMIRIDKQRPTITDDYALDNVWTNTNQTVHLNPNDGNGSGVGAVLACEDGNCTPTNNVAAPYALTYTVDQHKTVRYKAVDAAGNESAIGSYVVKLDKTAPTVSDDYDNAWHTSDFTINVSSTDNLSGVERTGYLVYNDESPSSTRYVENDGQPSINYEDNDTWLEYWARDNAGNESEHVLKRGIKLDKTRPETSDNADSDWHNSDVTVVLTGIDPTVQGMPSGVNDILYMLYHDEVAQAQQSVSANGNPVVNYEDNDNWIEYWATDNAGNIEEHKTVKSIKVDKTVPVIELSLGNGNIFAENPLPLVENIYDPQVQGTPSGNVVVTYTLDGQAVNDPSNISGFLCGVHTLGVTATDAAGNSSSESIEFEVAVNASSLFITPETLRVNPGVIMVHPNLQPPYDIAVITSATLDGAPMDMVTGTEVKFRRQAVQDYLTSVGQTLDTHFIVEGILQYNGNNCTFFGEDDISKIVD